MWNGRRIVESPESGIRRDAPSCVQLRIVLPCRLQVWYIVKNDRSFHSFTGGKNSGQKKKEKKQKTKTLQKLRWKPMSIMTVRVGHTCLCRVVSQWDIIRPINVGLFNTSEQNQCLNWKLLPGAVGSWQFWLVPNCTPSSGTNLQPTWFV